MADFSLDDKAASKLKKVGLHGNDVKVAFFDRFGEGDDTGYKCKECARVYKSKSGNSNLIAHAACHEGWIGKILSAKASGGPLDSYVTRKVSSKASNIFKWMELCVMNDEAFHFVENPFTRKYSRLEPISIKTLIKYLELVRTKVEEKLRVFVNAVTPKRFGLVFDSWTCNSEHYTAIFITWSDKNGIVHMYNMCCGVQDEVENEDISFSAEALGDYFFDELQLLGLSLFENVDFICGDNCAVNKRLATLISNVIASEKGAAAWRVPLVGCASHRINLAREAFYSSDQNAPVIEKVDQLMTKLRTLKNASKLRKLTNLRPENQNSTRWTSVNAALTKFKQLEQCLTQGEWDPDVLQLIPSAFESSQISAILSSDASFSNASKALQRGGENQLELIHVRSIFDRLIREQPDTEVKLGQAADIIHDPHFESAVCKIQAFDEVNLTVPEKKAVKRFLVTEEPAARIADDDESDGADDDWVQDIIDKTDARKKQKLFKSKYRPLPHVAPTSNVCERLFSRAKLIMRPHRKHMSPFHLEMMIFLRCNKALWNETTVEDCLLESSDDVVAAAPAQATL